MRPLILLLSLVTGLARVGGAVAEEIYQWRDNEGGVHLGSVPPADTDVTLVYRQAPGDRIFHWQDETGLVHFSDVPPDGTAKPREILIEPPAESVTDDEYSIIRQAERMAEDRRRIEEARILRERTRLERSQMARDMAVLRMQEQLRTRGYGPRPDPYAYSYSYDPYW